MQWATAKQIYTLLEDNFVENLTVGTFLQLLEQKYSTAILQFVLHTIKHNSYIYNRSESIN
jgi:hypothetical protein